MGITERRQREKEALSQKIIDAAREIFVREGYEAVTMRRIAERIEYSATAIYSHFKDKDSLLRAVTDVDFQALTERLHAFDDISDPLERLKKMTRAYVDFGVQNPNQYRLIFMNPIPPTPPEAAAATHGDPEEDAYAWVIQVLKEILADGRLNFAGQDLDLVAQTIWSAFHGVVSLHIAMDDEPWVKWATIEARCNMMFDTLMGGFRQRAK